MNGGLVHELDGDGYDARGDDGRDTAPGDLTRLEAEQHGPRRLGRTQNAHGRLGDDAELPLRSNDQPEQVIARGIEVRAADLDHTTVDEHHLHTEHIVGRHAVLEAMRAAGIHRDVARKRARELARRIGRVEKAVRLDGA